MTSPVWTSSTMPVPPSALIAVTAAASSLSIAAWTRAVDRQRDRAAALGRVGQPLVEHPLHAGDAVAVEIGPAEDMAGQRGLRIEPLGLAAEDDAGSPSPLTAATSSGTARRRDR